MISKNQQRLEQIQKSIAKRMFDKWKKVLKHLDINENLLSAKDELLKTEPFLTNSIANVKQNHFRMTQMDKFCAEIT